jgi:hypothetical protein
MPKNTLTILAANSIVDAAKLVQHRLDIEDPTDAVDIVQLLIQANADGAAKKYGTTPLKSADFADDAAIDCEHIESLLFLDRHAVRKMYLSVYAAALKDPSLPKAAKYGVCATKDNPVVYDQKKSSVLHIYIDPLDGNDANDGLSAKSAMRTLAELKDRLMYGEHGRMIADSLLRDVQ